MADQLAKSLDTIADYLHKLKRPSAGLLRVGLDAQVIHEALAVEGLHSNDELVTLYEWRNGTVVTDTAALDDLHFFPGFYFLSLEEALANYGAFRADDRWDPNWLPLFANGGGDFYVLSLDQLTDFGRIRHFRIDESEHPVEFLSITDFMRTLEKAFEKEIFFVDPDGYLEMEDNRFAELAAQENPTVTWWTEEV